MLPLLKPVPGKCPEDYLKAIARWEIALSSRNATATATKPRYCMFMVAECYSQNCAESHIELYNKFLDVSNYLLPSNKEQNRSIIRNWDIHAPNLFVEGNKVTGLMDWQDNWAGPLFLQARRPILAAFNGDIILELPEHYKDIGWRWESSDSSSSGKIYCTLGIWNQHKEDRSSPTRDLWLG